MKKFIFNSTSLNIDFGILLLRFFSGGFMLTHGIPKLVKLLNGQLMFGDPIGIGPEASLVLVVFAEFLCAILVIVGLWTRFATVSLMITMFVAGFVAMGTEPFGKKELALLYFGMYLVIFFAGAGKYALDNRLGKK